MSEQEPLLFSETAPATSDAKPFRKVLDLGGGAGAEVFEANTLEELVDVIADAKLHASAKIRQQEATIRAQEAELSTRNADRPVPTELSPDDEYIITQELQKTPSKAFRKLFKQYTGAEPEEFASVKQAYDAFKNRQQSTEVASAAVTEFLAAHPEYEDDGAEGEENTRRIQKEFKSLGLTWPPKSSDQLTEAYLSLKVRGELFLRGNGANGNAREPYRATKKMTTIGTQNRTAATPVSTEPSEDTAYEMPLERLRQLANKQMSGRG